MSNKCSYFFPAFTRSRSLEIVYSKCIFSVFYPDDIFRFVPQKRIFLGFFSNRSFYLLFRYVYFFLGDSFILLFQKRCNEKK